MFVGWTTISENMLQSLPDGQLTLSGAFPGLSELLLPLELILPLFSCC
jgi:hypothetical protein